MAFVFETVLGHLRAYKSIEIAFIPINVILQVKSDFVAPFAGQSFEPSLSDWFLDL